MLLPLSAYILNNFVVTLVHLYHIVGGQRSGWGDMYLYFGCRHATIDNIYHDELEKLENERVLTSCYFAYSREPGLKKVH